MTKAKKTRGTGAEAVEALRLEINAQDKRLGQVKDAGKRPQTPRAKAIGIRKERQITEVIKRAEAEHREVVAEVLDTCMDVVAPPAKPRPRG